MGRLRTRPGRRARAPGGDRGTGAQRGTRTHAERAAPGRLPARRVPFRARITIADNGSSDGTWVVAAVLAAELPEVQAVRLKQSGRGRALRSCWLGSDAEVLAYTDVDLSTGLNALLPLVSPLLSGHSDTASS